MLHVSKFTSGKYDMRKTVTLVICAIYVLCIIFVSFFGLKFASYNPIVYTTRIGITSGISTAGYDPNDTYFDGMELRKIVHYSGSYPVLGTPIAAYELTWRVYPDNISRKDEIVSISCIFDSVPYTISVAGEEIVTTSFTIIKNGEFSAEIIFHAADTFTVIIRANDGSKKEVKLQFVVI